MEWVDIKQVCTITGKSLSSVRRLANQLKKEGSDFIMFEELKTGHNKIYFNSEYIKTAFQKKVNSSSNTSKEQGGNTSSEQLKTLQILEERIKFLEGMLLMKEQKEQMLLQERKRRWWHRKN